MLRRTLLGLTIAGLALAGAAPVASAQLPALPELPGVPGLLPGSGAPAPGSNPPRPDRPPRAACADRPGSAGRLRGAVVFSCDFPDPMVLRVGRRYFAYATATGWERGRRTFPILSSTDLRRWHPVGNALSRKPRWAAGHLWAPSVLRAGGRYFMYYSARRASDELHCLAVATARRPEGPFRDRGIIRCKDRGGAGYIDPAPLVHRGRVYLYFSVDSPRHSLAMLRLGRSLLRARGRTRTLLGVARPWQRGLVSETVEGPWPLRRGNRVYLFYSAGCWCLDYRMGYAVARQPMGPFRDARSNPVLRGGATLVAPGGGSLFTTRGGRSWLAFHAWTGARSYARGGVRSLRLAPVGWRGRRPRLGLR